jgi:hypothetical protein
MLLKNKSLRARSRPPTRARIRSRFVQTPGSKAYIFNYLQRSSGG